MLICKLQIQSASLWEQSVRPAERSKLPESVDCVLLAIVLNQLRKFLIFYIEGDLKSMFVKYKHLWKLQFYFSQCSIQ